MPRSIIAFVLIIMLNACSPQALVANYKLRNVDPLTTPAKDLRVALEVPKEFQPRKDRIAMAGSLSVPDVPDLTERFELVPADKGALEQALLADMAQSDRLHVFRIAPDRIAAFDRFRQSAKAAQDSGAKGQGSLTVDSPVCSNVISLPDRVPVTVHLKVGEVGEYVTLVRDEDVLDDTNTSVLLPRCD